MQLGLARKVVLVTGGGKGIGRSIVEGLLKEGAHVWFCDQSEADVKKAHLELCAKYPHARSYGVVADVTNPDEIHEWINNAIQLSGQIDVLVSNLSVLHMQDIAERWAGSFDDDLMGAVTLVQAALPHLEKTKGNIVTVRSVPAHNMDSKAASTYGELNAALVRYMSQLSVTLAPKGIRANTVSPGDIYAKDGMWGEIEEKDPELFGSQLAKNPMGRMGKLEEIADVVVFLASDRAGFVSGANVVVDGALSVGVQP